MMRSLVVMISLCVFLFSTLFVASTTAQMMCIQGGQPPAACPLEGQYRWDNTICAWVCNNPIPTTPTPEPGRVCRQGGQPPAECPGEGESVWDNTRCAFVCKTCAQRGRGCAVAKCGFPDRPRCVEDPSTCVATCVSDTVMCIAMCKQVTCPGYSEQQTVCNKVINNVCTWECPAPPPQEPVCSSCAATTCLTGTTCIEKNGCATCKPNVCEDKCAVMRCSSGPCVQDSKCVARCTTGPGTVVLTATFTLTWSSYSQTAENAINAAMKKVAEKAGIAKDFVINDIQKKKGGNQKWTIKVGFKGNTKVDRVSALDAFFDQLDKQKYTTVRTNEATSTWGFTSDDTLETATETMTMQTCADGNQMSVEQQCPLVDDFIVPASTSSASSTPIAAIIAPVVAGIVLVTAVAAAIIIIRRRRINTIKTMDRMETEMTNNPAIASQV